MSKIRLCSLLTDLKVSQVYVPLKYEDASKRTNKIAFVWLIAKLKTKKHTF